MNSSSSWPTLLWSGICVLLVGKESVKSRTLRFWQSLLIYIFSIYTNIEVAGTREPIQGNTATSFSMVCEPGALPSPLSLSNFFVSQPCMDVVLNPNTREDFQMRCSSNLVIRGYVRREGLSNYVVVVRSCSPLATRQSAPAVNPWYFGCSTYCPGAKPYITIVSAFSWRMGYRGGFSS